MSAVRVLKTFVTHASGIERLYYYLKRLVGLVLVLMRRLA